jgi:hypothetical protein
MPALDDVEAGRREVADLVVIRDHLIETAAITADQRDRARDADVIAQLDFELDALAITFRDADAKLTTARTRLAGTENLAFQGVGARERLMIAIADAKNGAAPAKRSNGK